MVYLLGEFGRRINSQIELDQFTGKMAIELRAVILTIEKSEDRVQKAKKIVVASCLVPNPVCAELTDLYEKYVIVEEQVRSAARNHWKAYEKNWHDHFPFLSQKSVFPDPDEAIENASAKFKIQYRGLTSEAEVWTTLKGTKPHAWQVAWTQ